MAIDAAGALRLSVEDDGPGIPEAQREQVFERFHRGSGHEAPGSGLGLAIVRQAVLRNGGRVVLGEGLGRRGAGFHVTLPVAGR
ncbi:sensor histidine kinase [Variovorax davisae]|uniref:sensor histidine kinase n=1 Tax=Variovorax davisae TaxID=3053515 RepID=UPI00336587F1